MERLQVLVGQLLVDPCNSNAGALQGNFVHGGAAFQHITSERFGRVQVITLNRPKALNALCDALMHEVLAALKSCEKSGAVGCIVITGSGKAFAAGADIKEMQDNNYHTVTTKDHIGAWDGVSKCKIPIVAAVNGYCLGGGCELAMMCDIIYASTKAKFGQPEIKLGTIPGAGGTQRLTQAIGKSKAMEMVLTGRIMGAQDMLQAGLAARVCDPDRLMPEAMALAKEIADKSLPVVKHAKAAVLSSFELPLSAGITNERQLFYSTFALHDRQEGMDAFVKKKKPTWKHQ